jgi:hypothetical protein
MNSTEQKPKRKTRKQQMKAVKSSAAPKLTSQTIEALVRAHYCYWLLSDAAKDIKNLPQEPYVVAKGLAMEQASQLLAIYEKRNGREKAQALMERITAEVYPKEEEVNGQST